MASYKLLVLLSIGLFAGQAAAAKDALLILGGMTPSGEVEIFDPEANSWSSAQNLPGDVTMSAGPGFAVASLQTAVYLCDGGMMEANCKRYDVATDKWSEDVGSPKRSRGFAAMTAPGDGFIYKAGGMGMDPDPEWMYDSPIEQYDPAKNSWKVMAKLPKVTMEGNYVTGQYNTAATSAGGAVFLMGYDPQMGTPHNFVKYDPKTNKVTALAKPPKGPEGPMNSCMGGPPGAPALVGTKLGGKDFVLLLDGCAERLDRFDVQSESWDSVTLKSPAQEGKIRKSPAAVIGQNLYIVGGMSDMEGTSSKTFRLPLEADAAAQSAQEWESLADMKMPRFDFQVVAIKK